jgi:acetate kinase
MSKKYIIVNTGSTSKKYAFYEDSKKIYSAHFEIENGNLIVTETINGESKKRIINKKDYPKAVGVVISSLIDNKIINSKKEITCAAVRIVAPGEYFLKNKLIDKEYLKMANLALEKVPLHLGPALEEVKNIKEFLGNKTPIFGISDSAFHSTIPEHARFYAIPIKDTRKLGLYQFGYHGISVQSVISRAKDTLGKLPEKVIVCHLGGGASVTAVKNGQSIDTSMGFTPLEGLIMATRVGDIDPGAVLYLAEKLKKNGRELEIYFNNKCGLLGLSGKSSDLRDLIELEKNGDVDSTLALKIYTNKIKQYIGRMAAVLGGVDLLILAGTVGERSIVMRDRICSDLKFLGVELDSKINNKSFGVEALINKVSAPTKVLIVKTDEMEEMAKSTYSLLK